MIFDAAMLFPESSPEPSPKCKRTIEEANKLSIRIPLSQLLPDLSNGLINCAASQSRSQSRSRSPSTSRSTARSQQEKSSRRSRSTLSSRNSTRSRSPVSRKKVEQMEKRQLKMEKNIESIKIMVGKTYFLMKELARNGGGPSSSSFGTSLEAELVAPAGFEMPEFPLQNVGELLTFERNLANREIFNYVQESLKSSCVPSTSSSLTATLTKFINKTMSVSLP